jgi:hypothetical protein
MRSMESYAGGGTLLCHAGHYTTNAGRLSSGDGGWPIGSCPTTKREQDVGGSGVSLDVWCTTLTWKGWNTKDGTLGFDEAIPG